MKRTALILAVAALAALAIFTPKRQDIMGYDIVRPRMEKTPYVNYGYGASSITLPGTWSSSTTSSGTGMTVKSVAP